MAAVCIQKPEVVLSQPWILNGTGPEVLFKTCVAMKFVDDDDDDDGTCECPVTHHLSQQSPLANCSSCIQWPSVTVHRRRRDLPYCEFVYLRSRSRQTFSNYVCVYNIVTHLLSCTASEMWGSLVTFLASIGVQLFNEVVPSESVNSGLENFALKHETSLYSVMQLFTFQYLERTDIFR